MRTYQIMKLPSGFWCVFFKGNWLTASLASAEACKAFIEDHKKTIAKKK